MREILPSGFANNKGADQLAHPRSLISAFAIHKLNRIVFKLAPSEISLFYLVSVAEKAGFGMILSETLKTGSVAPMLIYTEQQKKRIFCIFGIVYKMGFKY